MEGAATVEDLLVHIDVWCGQAEEAARAHQRSPEGRSAPLLPIGRDCDPEPLVTYIVQLLECGMHEGQTGAWDTLRQLERLGPAVFVPLPSGGYAMEAAGVPLERQRLLSRWFRSSASAPPMTPIVTVPIHDAVHGLLRFTRDYSTATGRRLQNAACARVFVREAIKRQALTLILELLCGQLADAGLGVGSALYDVEAAFFGTPDSCNRVLATLRRFCGPPLTVCSAAHEVGVSPMDLYGAAWCHLAPSLTPETHEAILTSGVLAAYASWAAVRAVPVDWRTMPTFLPSDLVLPAFVAAPSRAVTAAVASIVPMPIADARGPPPAAEGRPRAMTTRVIVRKVRKIVGVGAGAAGGASTETTTTVTTVASPTIEPAARASHLSPPSAVRSRTPPISPSSPQTPPAAAATSSPSPGTSHPHLTASSSHAAGTVISSYTPTTPNAAGVTPFPSAVAGGPPFAAPSAVVVTEEQRAIQAAARGPLDEMSARLRDHAVATFATAAGGDAAFEAAADAYAALRILCAPIDPVVSAADMTMDAALKASAAEGAAAAHRTWMEKFMQGQAKAAAEQHAATQRTVELYAAIAAATARSAQTRVAAVESEVMELLDVQ